MLESIKKYLQIFLILLKSAASPKSLGRKGREHVKSDSTERYGKDMKKR